MIKYYLKLALRNLQGNKVTKGVKIIGMALAITISMVIFLFVNHELSYDCFFSNHENVYRILNDVKQIDGTQSKGAPTPIPLAEEIKQNFPEIQYICRITKNRQDIFYYNEFIFETNSTFNADSTFFKIYDVNIITGDANSILSEPKTAAISKMTAKKIFGNEEAIGKTIKLNNRESYTISGVFEDFPTSSIMNPEIILSMLSNNWVSINGKSRWDSHILSTIVLLQPETDLKYLSEKINNLTADKVKLMPGHQEWKFEFQPITEVHFDKYSWGDFNPGVNRELLHILQLVALFIIIIALLNHVNISTNLRLKQVKQNSIDKVFGMKKKQQFLKILTETKFDFFTSLVLAIILLLLFLPQINQLLDKNILLFSYPLIWIFYITGLLLISFLTAYFESIIVSKINFVSALKGNLGKKQSGKWIKQTVLITQYAIAVILIFLTAVVYMQTRYLINRDLGMNRENILIIKAQTIKINQPEGKTKKQLFLDEIKKFPEVKSATFTNVIPGKTSATVYKYFAQGQPSENAINCLRIQTDNNYIETFDIPLIAGENIRQQKNGNPNTDIIMTKSSVRFFGFKNLMEAVGNTIVMPFSDNLLLNIVGVTDDFFINNLYARDIKVGIIMEYSDNNNCDFAIKYNDTNELTLVKKIQETWKDVFEEPSMNYYFLNDSYRKVYKTELIQRQIFILFSFIAVIIACFGIFAMAFETIVQRTKEIGIRKVNGAKTQNILILLFRNYVGIISIAIIPGLIITYLVASRWLENYDNKIPISWYFFIIPIVLIAIATLISVIYHSYKAAVSNPINALKYE
jgi:putative ABC transport system permease protein